MDDKICFIDPMRNDKFSSLRGFDLQELIDQIENFDLVYRDSLNLPTDLTIGLEIEYQGIQKHHMDKYIDKNVYDWTSGSDGTVNHADGGGEIRSPMLIDEAQTWKDLKKICEHLRKNGARMNDMAGGHIHIGAHILGVDCVKWRRFLKVYTAYENVIFRFFLGDKMIERTTMAEYAYPLADDLYPHMKAINDIRSFYSMHHVLKLFLRNRAINFDNVHHDADDCVRGNTVEYRAPNSSSEEVIWQNNVNTCSKLMLSPNSSTFDEEFLDYKLKSEHIQYASNKYMYNEICLKKALEFVDIVFDNNLDKVYFLRQYFKCFQDNYGFTEVLNAPRFIK